jgi:hypothetical protein
LVHLAHEAELGVVAAGLVNLLEQLGPLLNLVVDDGRVLLLEPHQPDVDILVGELPGVKPLLVAGRGDEGLHGLGLHLVLCSERCSCGNWVLHVRTHEGKFKVWPCMQESQVGVGPLQVDVDEATASAADHSDESVAEVEDALADVGLWDALLELPLEGPQQLGGELIPKDLDPGLPPRLEVALVGVGEHSEAANGIVAWAGL